MKFGSAELEELSNEGAELYACVPSLLEALGWRGKQEGMLGLFATKGDDLSLEDLAYGLKRFGYQTMETSIDRRTLSIPAPSLVKSAQHGFCTVVGLEEDAGHFLVYSGRSRNYVQLEQSEIQGSCWWFKTRNQNDLGRTSPFWFQKLLGEHGATIGVAVLFSLILTIFGVLTPSFISLLYVQISVMTDASQLILLSMGVLLFVLGELGFKSLRSRLLLYLKREFETTIGKESLRRVLYFPRDMTSGASLKEQEGRLAELQRIPQILGSTVAQSLLDFPFVVLLFVALGSFGGSLVLVPLVSVIMLLIMLFFFYPILKRQEAELAEAEQIVKRRQEAILEKGNTIRTWGVEEFWARSLEEAELDALHPRMTRVQFSSTFNFATFGLVSITGIITVVMGLEIVFRKPEFAGNLLASMMLVWRILDPFRSLFTILSSFQDISRSIKRLQKFMALEGENQPDPQRPELRMSTMALQLEGVYYRYPQGGPLVVSNVNASLEAGRTVVIRSVPASGKSTLAMLCCGLLHPKMGRIMVNGQNLPTYDPVLYRRKTTFIDRTPLILPESVEGNLCLGNHDPVAEKRDQVLEALGLDKDIHLLGAGADTALDEHFQALSPDFFRAIDIARGLMRDTPLLIMEDPLTGLGPARQEALLAWLRAKKGTRTMILFSNDPRIIELADQRYSLDKGRLVLLGGST